MPDQLPVLCIVDAHVLSFQKNLFLFKDLFLILIIGVDRHLATHHFRDQPLLIVAVFFLFLLNDLAVAKHGDHIGACHNLMKLVGDQKDRITVIAHRLKHFDKFLCLLLCQHTGWLIKNQYTHFSHHQYLDDLHPLSLSQIHLTDQHIRINRNLIFL